MKHNFKSVSQRFAAVVAGSLLLVGTKPSHAAVQYYKVFDLGSLGGNYSYSVANAINNSGQIVGYSKTVSGLDHAAFWNNSSSAPIDLGTLGGNGSVARGINSSGQIVGIADTAGGQSHAAFWDTGSTLAIDLHTLGGAYSEAFGINNYDQIVGDAYTAVSVKQHAAFWNNSGSSPIELGIPSGYVEAQALGINDSGQIVGYTGDPSGGTHALYWNDSSSLFFELQNIQGGTGTTHAYGINGSGQIVGSSGITTDNHSPRHAVLWNNSSSAPVDLGALGFDSSEALGINNSGQIVGYAYYGGGSRAALWSTHNSPAIDLNSVILANSGWVLHYANAINASGEIVGYGTVGGYTHAFALIPISTPPSPYLQVQPPDVYVILAPWPPPCLHCTNVFSVQRTTNLVSGAWSTIASNIVSTGGVMTNIDLGGATVPQRFYRVGLHIPNIKEASDDASNGAYTNGWANGSNSGMGYGAWTLKVSNTNSTSGNGFFVGSSTNNASGASPGIDVDGKSWGLYANSNNVATAYRAISNSVAVGGTFGIEMDNGNIETNNSVGFVLRSGNVSSNATSYTTGARFQFEYVGFDSSNSYKVVDSGGLHNIGVPFTGTGLRLVFTLTGANTYTLQTINNASGATNTFSGTLSGSGTLTSIALFNNNAGSNSPHDTFFNLMEIGSP